MSARGVGEVMADIIDQIRKVPEDDRPHFLQLVEWLAMGIRDVDSRLKVIERCPHCNGYGFIINYRGEKDECSRCHGTGKREGL